MQDSSTDHDPSATSSDVDSETSSTTETEASEAPNPIRVLVESFCELNEFINCDGVGYSVRHSRTGPLDFVGEPAPGAPGWVPHVVNPLMEVRRRRKSQLAAALEAESAAGSAVPGVACPIGAPLKRRILQLSATHRHRKAPATVTLANNVLAHLDAEACNKPPTPLTLRFCHRASLPGDEYIHVDLGRDDGKRITIKLHDWQVRSYRSNPQQYRLLHDDPPFRRSHTTRGLPDPEQDGCLNEFVELLSLDPGSDDARLLTAWVLWLPFESSIRPGVVLTGPPGSGKSTRLLLATSIWEPTDEHGLGGWLGRDPKGDLIRAGHRAIPLWDNVSDVSGTVSDLICTIITGTALEARELYSDTGLSTFRVRRPIGLTAVGLPPGLRPDAMERLIHIELDGVDKPIDPPDLWAKFEKMHPLLLGAFCDAVSAVMAWKKMVRCPEGYRMAGFAHALAAYDAAVEAGDLYDCPTGLLDAYAHALKGNREMLAVEDVFGAALLAQMRTKPVAGQDAELAEQYPEITLLNLGSRVWPEVTAKGIMDELAKGPARPAPSGFDAVRVGGPGWPRSARGVPTRLNHLQSGLRELGLTWTTRPLHGSKHYTFTLREVEPHAGWPMGAVGGEDANPVRVL
jgi:energy-coupling factor transporter ATP-binding protein EcfA2